MTDIATGGSATATACIFTNPLEVIKTRLQLQGEMKAVSSGAGSVRYNGVADAMVKIARQEGVLSLQKGLVPGMIYQVVSLGLHAHLLPGRMILRRMPIPVFIDMRCVSSLRSSFLAPLYSSTYVHSVSEQCCTRSCLQHLQHPYESLQYTSPKRSSLDLYKYRSMDKSLPISLWHAIFSKRTMQNPRAWCSMSVRECENAPRLPPNAGWVRQCPPNSFQNSVLQTSASALSPSPPRVYIPLCSIGPDPGPTPQIFMNGTRLGTYPTLKRFLHYDGTDSLADVVRMIFAAALSGGMGAIVGSPFFMVKCRLQAQSTAAGVDGFQHHYRGMMHGLMSVRFICNRRHSGSPTPGKRCGPSLWRI